MLRVSNLLCAKNLILNFMIDINIMMVMMMVELTDVFFIELVVIFNAFSFVRFPLFSRNRYGLCHGNRRMQFVQRKKRNQNH